MQLKANRATVYNKALVVVIISFEEKKTTYSLYILQYIYISQYTYYVLIALLAKSIMLDMDNNYADTRDAHFHAEIIQMNLLLLLYIEQWLLLNSKYFSLLNKILPVLFKVK